MDPDFVDISTFGEGFNIGPSFGFNFPIASSLLVTTSVGYTWRGQFDQDSNIDPSKPFLTTMVDPGDDLTTTAAVNYQTGPFSAGLTGTITWETPTAVEGTRSFKLGNRYLVALQSSYKWPETFGTTTLSASAVHSGRNAVLIPGLNTLAVETLNSNSNLYRAGLQHMVPVGDLHDRTYRQRALSRPQRLQLHHAPIRAAKNTLAVGVLAQYAPSPNVTLNARVEGVWIHVNLNPAYQRRENLRPDWTIFACRNGAVHIG